MWTLLSLAAVTALAQDPPELPAEAHACVGRWDVTVDYGSRKGYAWLEIEPSGRILVGRYVGHGGSARPIAQVHWEKGSIRFDLPRQWERNDLKFQCKLDGEKLAGTIAGLEQGTMPFVAVRAPELKRAQEPSWGEPIELFNGKSLDGWRTFGRRRSQWSVKDGLMSNAGGGANIATNASFGDLKLVAEFRYPEGSNSGIYLRGRYEVQIQDDFGKEPNRHAAGSLYGFISPLVNAAKKAGDWQTMEITLVGRLLTVVYNGERIIERQIIPGITGGAIDCHEGEPGPIYIQGDHGPIEFRKLTVVPGAGPGRRLAPRVRLQADPETKSTTICIPVPAMGTAVIEGELWGAKARDWADRCEHVCRPLWEAMLHATQVGPKTRFLDLGCGAAGSSVIAAQRGARVSGFDASANLLQIARERVPEGDFRQGEMEELPYGDSSFDVVFAANSLQYVDNKDRALAEVRRIMAPGGRLAVGMWCEPERCEMSAVFKALMEIVPPPPNGPPTLSTRENLSSLLESNGFKIVSEGEVECVFVFESVEEFVGANTSPGIIVGIARAIGEEKLRETLERAVRPLAAANGQIRLSNWFRYMVCA